jgi:hypothetical protein
MFVWSGGREREGKGMLLCSTFLGTVQHVIGLSPTSVRVDASVSFCVCVLSTHEARVSSFPNEDFHCVYLPKAQCDAQFEGA